jgi:hypothetical protein
MRPRGLRAPRGLLGGARFVYLFFTDAALSRVVAPAGVACVRVRTPIRHGWNHGIRMELVTAVRLA